MAGGRHLPALERSEYSGPALTRAGRYRYQSLQRICESLRWRTVWKYRESDAVSWAIRLIHLHFGPVEDGAVRFESEDRVEDMVTPGTGLRRFRTFSPDTTLDPTRFGPTDAR